METDLVRRHRVDRFRENLAKSEANGAILLAPSHVDYFSGFRHYVPIRPLVLVIPLEGNVTFITPKIEYEYAAGSSWIDDVRYYTEFPEDGRHQSALALLEDVLHEKGLADGTLAYETEFVSLAMFSELEGRFKNVQWIDGSVLLREQRIIKDEQEIEMLRMAGQIALVSWEAALKTADVGVREYEVALAARDAGTRYGADHYSETDDRLLSPIVEGTQIMITSEESSIPHGRASLRRLSRGDLVMMCFCNVNVFRGYRVGFCRHFSLGPPSDDQKKVYQICHDAQEAALEVVRPLTLASRVDEVAREYLGRHDLERFLTHRTGRGVGLDVAEAPDLKEGDNTVLAQGMTFSVEPAVYIPGDFGIQIEDSVVVTGDGWASLTPSPKELVVL